MSKVAEEVHSVMEASVSTMEDHIGFLDILAVLARSRRMIMLLTLASLVAGTLFSFLLKPNFTATALIMPPQQQSSLAGALMGQLGPLGALGGDSGGLSLGMRTPTDMYIGILESRTIADSLIQQFQLAAVYKRTHMEDARLALKSHTEIDSGKDGLIRIAVTDHDPNRASNIANAYVSELYRLNSNLAITEAAQRRVFFDEQLEEEKRALTAAEDDQRATQQRTGVIQLSGQAEMIIRSIAELRAQIASREVELQSMLTFATNQNPDVSRIQEEISTMRSQLSRLENDESRKTLPGDIAVPAGQVAEDSLEYTRKLREVKYHETLFDLLSKQFEAARIDEAKSAPIIRVIDHALPPDKKSGPHRLLIVLGFGFAGFCGVCLASFLKVGLRNLPNNPLYARKLALLKESFR